MIGRLVCWLFGHSRAVEYNGVIDRLWCRRCGRHVTFEEWLR